MLRAIVFDFDGVIADSEPLHYRAFCDVLAESGVQLSKQEYYGLYLGYDDLTVVTQVAAASGLSWSPGRVKDLVAIKAERLEWLERDASILFPGAHAAIRRLGSCVPLAIASGALGTEIRRVLDRERLMSCFTAIVAAEDTPVSKPAPDAYRRAVELMAEADGMPPHPTECVAVEDSPWGLESARAAGLCTVAVAHTYPRAKLKADLVIETLDELDLAQLRQLCAV